MCRSCPKLFSYGVCTLVLNGSEETFPYSFSLVSVANCKTCSLVDTLAERHLFGCSGLGCAYFGIGPGGVKWDGCSTVSFVLLVSLSCLRNCIMSKDFIMSVQREKPIYLIIYLFHSSDYVALIVWRNFIHSAEEKIWLYERLSKSRIENTMHIFVTI
jgi:hypothetical protein